MGVKDATDSPIPFQEKKLESCKDVMNKDYRHVPFKEKEVEPVEWSHVLATLDVCTMNHEIKFCDEEGYDIIPIKMVQVLNDPREKAQKCRKGM